MKTKRSPNDRYLRMYPDYIFIGEDRRNNLNLDHPEHNRWNNLARYYGLSYESVQGILKFQDYKDPISGEPLDLISRRPKGHTKGPWFYELDHDHKYGEAQGSNRPGLNSVRGFLTRRSNDWLGKLENMNRTEYTRENNPNFDLLEIVGRNSRVGRYLLNPPAQQYRNSLNTCLF